MSRDVLQAFPNTRFRLYNLAFNVLSFVPYRFGLVLALLSALAVWLIDARGRTIVRSNLAPLMPGASLRVLQRAARRSYVHFCLALNETFRLHHLPKWLLAAKNCSLVDPYGNLPSGPLQGGHILATVHCNWELLIALGHQRGWIPSSRVIALSHSDPRIDDLFDRVRSAVGCRSVLLERAPLASLRALREGRALGVVADRDYTQTGIPVQLAGQHCTIPAGPAALAVQTQSPIIPVFLARKGASSFTLYVGKAIKANPTLGKGTQLPALAQQLADELGRFLQAAPSQWVAFHPHWDASTAAHSKPITGP